ncbi:hypothetical protein Q9233_002717 [Columba guinea]|nr:hypothetical protein Q9233_002717 [Columba guinea]
MLLEERGVNSGQKSAGERRVTLAASFLLAPRDTSTSDRPQGKRLWLSLEQSVGLVLGCGAVRKS